MKLKELYSRIKEETQNSELLKTVKCVFNVVGKEREPYVGDKPLDDRFEQLDTMYYNLKKFIEDGHFTINNDEVDSILSDFTNGLNFSNTETYDKGEEVTHLFKGLESENIKVWKAVGSGKVLFRGVSLDDWNRIKSAGKIDSDMRGSISKYEGINLAQTVSTAEYYLPTGKQGVILAIDPKGLKLFRLRDDYVRSFDPIPVKNIIKVSDVVVKDSMGSIVNGSPDKKLETIKSDLEKLGIKTKC